MESSLSTLVFSEQLQVDVGYIFSEHSQWRKINDAGPQTVPGYNNTLAENFLRTLSRQWLTVILYGLAYHVDEFWFDGAVVVFCN